MDKKYVVSGFVQGGGRGIGFANESLKKAGSQCSLSRSSVVFMKVGGVKSRVLVEHRIEAPPRVQNSASRSKKDDSRSPQRDPRDPQYHANVGAAIEAIREYYPSLLHCEPKMDIMTEDVVFTDRKSVYLQGKDAYLSLFWTLRFHAKLFFQNDAQVCIQSMYHDNSVGRLYVRWRLVAKPRIPGWNPGSPWILEGMSRYTFNSQGRVAEHDVDPAVRNGPTSLKPMMSRILMLGAKEARSPAGVGMGCSGSSPYRSQSRTVNGKSFSAMVSSDCENKSFT
mmetsp:Transcript_11516/g.20825  ORF Transcript_11516/g.20825 Transcript_11516/m.20825 type:complete len:281 (-) Transcript_11516:2955-3797(-)